MNTVYIHSTPHPRKHNYQKKLEKMIRRGKIAPAQAREIFVAHDVWCRINSGGYCNCDPAISVQKGSKTL